MTGPKAVGTPADDSNLALQAARKLGERVGRGPVAIALEKNIPAAGGLGGGASDAAAVLRLLQTLWPQVSENDVRIVAEEIGSDEAFFLTGGTARAQGRGETVTSLPPVDPHGVVVFIPRETIERKTARMFAALDRHAFDDGSVVARFVAGGTTQITGETVFNAFERVAFELFPWLAALWEDLERRTGEPIRLAGAGPCLFWIGPPDASASVASAAQGANCEVLETRTVQRT